MTAIIELNGERALVCEADGPLIDSEQRAVDLIGEAFSSRATLIAVPVNRLSADFFDLRSGLAGAIVQKFVLYRFKLAIIGDITTYLAASDALSDWVRECNRRGEVCFVPSQDDLAARLNADARAPGDSTARRQNVPYAP
jgi:hypothetical protein